MIPDNNFVSLKSYRKISKRANPNNIRYSYEDIGDKCGVFARYSVVCGRPAHVPISLWTRISVLETGWVKMLIGNWSVRDSAENNFG